MLLKVFPVQVQKIILALATGLALRLYFGGLGFQLFIVFFPHRLRNARLASSITFSIGRAVLSGGSRNCGNLCS